MSQEGAAREQPASGFQQRLGLFDATMLVAGSMIGSGIFIVSSDIARDVGASGWLLLVWVLTGVMTIFGGLSYAELAAMMPRAGGQYVYLREAYGPLWGFLYGWTSFLVIQTGTIAAVGVAFAKFLGVIVPSLGTAAILFRLENLNLNLSVPIPWMDEPLTFFKRTEFTISAGQIVAVVITLLLTFLNCRGIREGKWVQNVFTVGKTCALIALIVVGLTVAASTEAIQRNFSDPWGGITETEQLSRSQQVHALGPAGSGHGPVRRHGGIPVLRGRLAQCYLHGGRSPRAPAEFTAQPGHGHGVGHCPLFAGKLCLFDGTPAARGSRRSPSCRPRNAGLGVGTTGAQVGRRSRVWRNYLSTRHRPRQGRSCRHGRHGTCLSDVWRPHHGHCHHDFHVRLPQRSNLDGPAPVLCDGARRVVFPAGRPAQRRAMCRPSVYSSRVSGPCC